MSVQLTLDGKPVSPPLGSPSLVPSTSGQEDLNHSSIPNPFAAATSTQEPKKHVMPHRFDPLKAGSTNSTRNRGVEIFNVFAEASKKFPKFEDLDPKQEGLFVPFEYAVQGQGPDRMLLRTRISPSIFLWMEK